MKLNIKGQKGKAKHCSPFVTDPARANSRPCKSKGGSYRESLKLNSGAQGAGEGDGRDQMCKDTPSVFLEGWRILDPEHEQLTRGRPYPCS